MSSDPQESDLQGLAMACSFLPAYFGNMEQEQGVIRAISSMSDIIIRLADLVRYCAERPELPVEPLCLHYLSSMILVRLKKTPRRSLKNKSEAYQTNHSHYLDVAVRHIESGRAHELNAAQLIMRFGCSAATYRDHFGSLPNVFEEAYEHMLRGQRK